MSNIEQYKEIVAFHPGYYIAEIIEDMGISQAEFATRMGTTPKTVSTLVNGQINLSNDLAKKIAVMLGTSPEVWLNLQNRYDQKLIEIEIEKLTNENENSAMVYRSLDNKEEYFNKEIKCKQFKMNKGYKNIIKIKGKFDKD